ncbi:MAG: hypothetical protein ACKVW3_01860 [Phycisphaerales bacterium]
MPAGVTLPYTFTPETEADANQIMAMFNALAAKYGAIVDGDIAPDADLDGNKISQAATKRIPNLSLGDDAVNDRVLADSTTVDSGRAVGGDHIKTLTTAAVARILTNASGSPVGAGIGLDKMAIQIHDRAGTAFVVAAGLTSYNMMAWGEIALGNWRGVVTGIVVGGGVTVMTLQQIVTPSVTFPSASYALLAVFPISVTYAGTSLGFTLRFVFGKLTSA